MNKKYKSFNHAKTKLRYHIIFSTKYRRNCLTQIQEEIKTYIKMAENENFRVLIMEIDKCHIHLLLEIKPSESISNVVHRLKQFSTYYAWQNFDNHLKQFYWSRKHYLWTRGYFVSTIGEVSEDKVINYIKNQG